MLQTFCPAACLVCISGLLTAHDMPLVSESESAVDTHSHLHDGFKQSVTMPFSWELVEKEDNVSLTTLHRLSQMRGTQGEPSRLPTCCALQEAYRASVLKRHPDKAPCALTGAGGRQAAVPGGAEEPPEHPAGFVALQRAWEVLRHPSRRVIHDRQLAAGGKLKPTGADTNQIRSVCGTAGVCVCMKAFFWTPLVLRLHLQARCHRTFNSYLFANLFASSGVVGFTEGTRQSHPCVWNCWCQTTREPRRLASQVAGFRRAATADGGHRRGVGLGRPTLRPCSVTRPRKQQFVRLYCCAPVRDIGSCWCSVSPII